MVAHAKTNKPQRGVGSELGIALKPVVETESPNAGVI